MGQLLKINSNETILMEDNLTYYEMITPKDINVGDTIMALSTYSHQLSEPLMVTEVGNVDIHTSNGEYFTRLNGYWTYYLVEKAKPKLPDHEGARIVIWKAEGIEYPDGRIVRHDGSVTAPWEHSLGYYEPEDIEEWAEIPEGFFDALKPQN